MRDHHSDGWESLLQPPVEIFGIEVLERPERTKSPPEADREEARRLLEAGEVFDSKKALAAKVLKGRPIRALGTIENNISDVWTDWTKTHDPKK